MNEQNNILHFWRDIEIFNLPNFPKANQGQGRLYPLKTFSSLPWQQIRSTEKNKKWSYTLFFGKIPQKTIVAYVDNLLKNKVKEEWEEPIDGYTCLSCINLDEKGKPNFKSYTIASYVIGLTLLLRGKDLSLVKEKLEESSLKFLERYNIPQFNEAKEELPTGDTVSWEHIKNEIAYLKEENTWLTQDIEVYVLERQIKKDNKSEVPFLNSFFLDDLNRLISSNDFSPTLQSYLSLSATDKKQDLIQNKQYLFNTINPQNLTAGRWPSKTEYGLCTAQMGAVNTIFSELDNFGIQGVNGPPGTGKTTLLLDVIAEIIVRRAKVLVNLGCDKLFNGYQKVDKSDSSYLFIYKLAPKLLNNFGIVVASNNNSAVENISKELPQAEKIDKNSFPEADYFADCASKITDKENWGVLAAALGNSTNKIEFYNNFWKNHNENEMDFSTILEKNLDNEAENRELFNNSVKEFKQLLLSFEKFKERAGNQYLENNKPKDIKSTFKLKTLLNYLITRVSSPKNKVSDNNLEELINKYEIETKNLFNEEFTSKDLKEIHLLSPYHSEKVATLRSQIFLKALEIHKYAILANAKKFNNNLKSFFEIILGRATVSKELTSILWDSFFLCVPVVSTSLASASRLFPNIDKNQIGWLLIDEAGQATPQSAVGLIQRSKRCVIVGDPLQIEPVVTISKNLVNKFRNDKGISEVWSPYASSVQKLADRISVYGTEVDENTWTGFPLRTHRRCQDPMFSIANKIAYLDQMVLGTPTKESSEKYLGVSYWFDVVGGGEGDSQVIKEEIEFLSQKIAELRRTYQGNIYVISPFKAVAKECDKVLREKFNDSKILCGTIHTFQGKESDVVFLVLGSQPNRDGSRRWASEKPNMLNVAVTRAKKRCYIIGNKKLWIKHPIFSVADEILNTSAHPII